MGWDLFAKLTLMPLRHRVKAEQPAHSFSLLPLQEASGAEVVEGMLGIHYDRWVSRERMDKAAKKAARVQERWGQNPERRSVWEICDTCGSKLCTNNYPGGENRPLKKFMGMSHCVRCPKNYKQLIRALRFIRWAAKQEGPIADKAQELLERT